IQPDNLTEEQCKMDRMQPILPAERIRIYGLDGSRDAKAQAKHQKLESNIKILDEKITHRCCSKESGVRWLQGAHPHIGEIIQGRTGVETVQRFTRLLKLDMQN
ncbi:MAG: hypothetical protein EBS89_10000, partial [Proteobacteria bacterium]|nr:hypothetical protein [Pseudomonadota bacterium]